MRSSSSHRTAGARRAPGALWAGVAPIAGGLRLSSRSQSGSYFALPESDDASPPTSRAPPTAAPLCNRRAATEPQPPFSARSRKRRGVLVPSKNGCLSAGKRNGKIVDDASGCCARCGSGDSCTRDGCRCLGEPRLPSDDGSSDARSGEDRPACRCRGPRFRPVRVCRVPRLRSGGAASRRYVPALSGVGKSLTVADADARSSRMVWVSRRTRSGPSCLSGGR